MAVLPAAGARRADAVRIYAQLYVSKPGVASSSSRRAALAIIPCCQEMPRPSDGVSEARTDFVRDVSDGSRPVYRRLLFFARVLQDASSADSIAASFWTPLRAVLHIRVASALYDSHKKTCQRLDGTP